MYRYFVISEISVARYLVSKNGKTDVNNFTAFAAKLITFS